MKTGLLFAALFLLMVIVSNAQELQVVSTAGETYTNDEVSVSWTIGEPVIETFESGDIILTQGFHQESYSITAIDEIQSVDLKITLFPNPAKEEFFIKYEGENMEDLKARIHDLKGNVILIKDINSEISNINIADLKAAEYIISIQDNNKILRSYKLVKN